MPIYKSTGSKNGKQKYLVRINYYDNTGKARQLTRTAYGSAEAKELERILENEVKEKSIPTKMTVQALYDEYIIAKKHELRETSYDKTVRHYRDYIKPYIGDINIDKLNAPVLQKWKSAIEAIEIMQKDKTTRPLALKTKHNIYSELRALLNYAVKMEYLPGNPLLKLGNFKDTTLIENEMDFYTEEEFCQFITSAREHAEISSRTLEWDYYVFFCIAFFTGLRKGEIHALKWSDIDGEYLNVKRSITQKAKGNDRETAPKNRSSIRTLQIPAPLQEVLRVHKERWKRSSGFSEDYRITGGTRPLRDTSIENANQKYAKLAGIKKIRIHDFRHSHASLLINNNINIQEIARRLGHSKIEMTLNTYAHLYPREEERAIKVLNEVKL